MADITANSWPAACRFLPEPATTSGGFPDRVDDARRATCCCSRRPVSAVTASIDGGQQRQWTPSEDVARLVAELAKV